MNETELSIRQDAVPAVLTLNASAYARTSKADNTIDAYEAAWEDFTQFCTPRHYTPLPCAAAHLVNYLTYLADGGQRVSTIDLKLAAIAFRHRLNHFPPPTDDEQVKVVMAGIRRRLGIAPHKKQPVTLTDLRAMVAALPDSVAGIRNRAVILMGWAGAMRRSEIVGLNVADVELGNRLVIRVRKSKTDQEGAGMVKVIPPLADQEVCSLIALRRWLSASGVGSGPLFRAVDQWGHVRDSRLSDRSVALIVKSAALGAGLDPTRFAGHSLRSGFITEAASAGVESRNIMAQTGHKSETVMRSYIQDAGRGATEAVLSAFGEKRKDI